MGVPCLLVSTLSTALAGSTLKVAVIFLPSLLPSGLRAAAVPVVARVDGDLKRWAYHRGVTWKTEPITGVAESPPSHQATETAPPPFKHM